VRTYEDHIDSWDGFVEETLDGVEDSIIEAEDDRKAQDETDKTRHRYQSWEHLLRPSTLL
jgi:hypothetical protein